MNDVGISTVLFDEFDPWEHLPLLAEHEVAQIEFGPNCVPIWDNPVRLESLRAALDETGVRVNSIHAPFGPEYDISSPDAAVRERGIEAAGLCLRRLAELGGRSVIVHPSGEPIEDAQRDAHMERALDSLRRIEERIPDGDGFSIAIEHLPRTCLCHDSRELLEVLDRLDSRRFGICQDVNHANLREDLCAATRQYGSRIVTLHISDNDGVDERHWLPGRGSIPWLEWKEQLLASGYDGPFLYEVGPWNEGHGLPEDAAARVAEIARNSREWFV